MLGEIGFIECIIAGLMAAEGNQCRSMQDKLEQDLKRPRKF